MSPKSTKNTEALNFLSNIKMENSTPKIQENKSPMKPNETPTVKLRSSPFEKYEKTTIQEKSKENHFRLFFTKRGFPFLGTSFIKFQKEEDGKKKESKRIILEDSSYEKILETPSELYDPTFLDDPSMGIGKKRKVVKFPGFLSSTIPFVRKEEVLDDLNQTFYDKHPDIASILSLSEIREIKLKMFTSMCEENTSVVELSTVALAIVYLERLITKGYVNKNNKLIVGAVCLLISVKFNENIKNLSEFFEEIEITFGFQKKRNFLILNGLYFQKN